MSLCSYPTTTFLVISSVQYTLAFISSSFGQSVSQGRCYDNMVLSNLANCGLGSGVWIDEYNNQNKDKNNIRKSMSQLFFSVQFIMAKTM